MIRNLTNLSVQKLKYNGKQKIYWNSNLRGFGVRVGKRTKTYVVMVGKHRKQISLGRYPTDKLKDERSKAKHILLQHAGRISLTLDDAKEELLTLIALDDLGY